MDYNVKGTVNGSKQYQTIELRCIDFNGSARSNPWYVNMQIIDITIE